jgi:HEXXH motif-containing protein
MSYHGLTADQISALSAGVGGPDVMAELNASRVSLHLLLLKRIADRWAADPLALSSAVGVLGQVQRLEPEAYAELIGDPLVGAWLTRTCAVEHPTEAACLHLGGLAAAAALRTRLSAELIGNADLGRVVLPTFGDGLLGRPATGPLTLAVDPDGRLLTGAAGAEIRLRPLRRLRAQHRGLAISVRLEDSNPYRDGYHAPPSERLSDHEADRWQQLFIEAWQLLVRCMPDWAAEITYGLRAIVPLVDPGDSSSRSGTAHESVGAMCMSRPRTAVDLAVTLVHEFQHSKLSAVIDITRLYRPNGDELHQVRWREDPRPTSGLIQGVYAFLGVADAWHRLRTVPELTSIADHQFSDIRAQVAEGLAALEHSTELTATGKHFTAGMRARLDALPSR